MAKKVVKKKNAVKGGLKSNKLNWMNWKVIVPVILLFAVVGGYFVYSSFAGSARTGNAKWMLGSGACGLETITESRNKSSSQQSELVTFAGIYRRNNNCNKGANRYHIQRIASRYAKIVNGRSVGDATVGPSGMRLNDSGWRYVKVSRYGNMYYKYTNIDVKDLNSGKCFRYLSKRNTSSNPVQMTRVGQVKC